MCHTNRVSYRQVLFLVVAAVALASAVPVQQQTAQVEIEQSPIAIIVPEDLAVAESSRVKRQFGGVYK